MTGTDDEYGRTLVQRWLAAFGRFWWEFLVGETPELFLGAFAAVGAVALIAHHIPERYVAVAVLPALVLAVLGASLVRARRAR